MNDRELLEFALKASFDGEEIVGLKVSQVVEHPPIFDQIIQRWNPLTDDADAFRLAVNLNIDVWYSPDCFIVGTTFMVGEVGYNTEENWTEVGKRAATRRAIVRAAAEIGKAKAN